MPGALFVVVDNNSSDNTQDLARETLKKLKCRYQILKESDDKFRLSNAGVAGTITENYIKRKYINITSTGTGYQNFSYPDITLTINAEYDGNIGIITATPLIRGKIVDLYLYESGTGYGSTILNFHKKPRIEVQVGKDAELKPLVADGRIISVQVTSSGSEYSSAPDLIVNGDGIGAKLRAIVNNKRVTSVIVVNPGVGYSANTTTIKAVPVGSNAFVEVSVRSLTLNNQYRFGNEILTEGQNGVENEDVFRPITGHIVDDRGQERLVETQGFLTPDAFLHVDAASPERGEPAPPDEGEGIFNRGDDTTDARRDAAFGDDLEESDVPGALHMRASAQFAG